MNLTLLLTVALVSFASGMLTVKYAPDSFKWFLLAFSLTAGAVLGWLIPPQFNTPVCLAVVAGGLIPVLSRGITTLYESRRRLRRGREVIKQIYG